MKFHLKKIISGGQTGVDLGALEAAMAVGVACGGWCPPDGSNEHGRISQKFGLKPTNTDRSTLAPGIPRSKRTEWNVRDSDGTMVIGLSGFLCGLGTRTTVELAEFYSKPVLELLLPDPKAITKATNWVVGHKIATMNIAGPSETEMPGVQQLTFDFIMVLLQQLVKLRTE